MLDAATLTCVCCQEVAQANRGTIHKSGTPDNALINLDLDASKTLELAEPDQVHP